jgi:hypothetical protein
MGWETRLIVAEKDLLQGAGAELLILGLAPIHHWMAKLQKTRGISDVNVATTEGTLPQSWPSTCSVFGETPLQFLYLFCYSNPV